ncbi:MAG: hypothetical protein E7612_03590 [Ruminococcaceae bacterium]|nr:hypothetical protein [Oscillospiraceae bacterium]
MINKKEEITFRDILDVFIPKIWIIVLVALLVASILAVYTTVFVEDSYTSYSVMSIRKDTEALQLTDITLAEHIIENISHRIQTREFLNKILLYVNQSYQGYEWLTISQISNSIRYSSLGGGILKLSVTTDNPQLSYAIAQALENEVPNEFYTYLPNALKVEPYSYAFIPSANSKGTVKNALIGFFAGAFVSAIAVWVYSVLDKTIKSTKSLENNFNLTILGVIPSAKASKTKAEEK